MSKEQKVQKDNTDEHLASLPTTSARIRYLTSLGWKRSPIAHKLNKSYQHVRNVQIQPIKGQ